MKSLDEFRNSDLARHLLVDAVLERMRRHPRDRDAVCIGRVTRENPGIPAAKASLGSPRVAPTQLDEQLPRIC